MMNASSGRRRAALCVRAGMIGLVTVACGEAPEQDLPLARETPAAKVDAVTTCPWGTANILRANAGFDDVGPSPWTQATSVVGASSVGWSAAAEWSVYLNSLGNIKTEHAPGLAGASGGAVRVETTSAAGGIVQVYMPHHTGPSRVLAKARVKVLRGTVGVFLGDGGRARLSAESTTTGAWEWLSGTSGVSPANEVAVYATSPGGAEYYVDEVSVYATECGLSSTDAWAFLWAHGTTGTYTPTSLYSASSAGLPATVAWSGIGQAEVTLPGIGTEVGGSVQVNAYGPSNERCKINDWKEYGADVHAFVSCSKPDGTPTSTRFVLAYVRKRSPSADAGGYVFADDPSLDGGYVPNPLRQWNSSGNLNIVYRGGVGTYKVYFPGISVGPGAAMVTAAGVGGSHCTIGGQSDSTVLVDCFDTFGKPVDERFSLNFSAAWPNLATSFAYANADDPLAVAYVPALALQRNVLGPASSSVTLPALAAGRNSVGSYFMNVPKLSALNSNALVVASGAPAGSYCKPAFWVPLSDASGTQISVSCFSWFGSSSDSVYNTVYTTQ